MERMNEKMKLLVNVGAYVIGYGIAVFISWTLMLVLEKAGAGLWLKAVTISAVSIACNAGTDFILRMLTSSKKEEMSEEGA